MTRHGKNSTASAVYSYSERKKDAKQSGYGTLHERLSADSIKEFYCCSITLQPCRDPVISPQGFVFDRAAVLEYYLQQKKENKRKLKEWEKQCQREEEDAKKREQLEEERRLKRLVAGEATPARPVIDPDLADDDTPTISAGAAPSGSNVGKKRTATDDLNGTAKRQKEEDSVSNVAGSKAKENPSFWVPQLNPTAAEAKLQKPDQRVLCPVSGRPLKIKELLPVKFTPIPGNEHDNNKPRYMCPVTHDALTNTTRCAYLKTSQSVVTMACVERIIRKDMMDPINGMALTEEDIIEMQRGGTGFSATNEVKAKLVRPQLELQ